MSWGFGDDKKGGGFFDPVSFGSSDNSSGNFFTPVSHSSSTHSSGDFFSPVSYGPANNSPENSFHSPASSGTFGWDYRPQKNWGEFPVDNSAYGPHFLGDAFGGSRPVASSGGNSAWTPSKGLWDPIQRPARATPEPQAPLPPPQLPPSGYSTYSPQSQRLSRPGNESAVGNSYQGSGGYPQRSYDPQTSYSGGGAYASRGEYAPQSSPTINKK